jgi:hypothetical protein
LLRFSASRARAALQACACATKAWLELRKIDGSAVFVSIRVDFAARLINASYTKCSCMCIYIAVSARAAPDLRKTYFQQISAEKCLFCAAGFFDLFDMHSPPKLRRCCRARAALVRTDIRSDGCVAYVLYSVRRSAGHPVLTRAHPTDADTPHWRCALHQFSQRCNI